MTRSCPCWRWASPSILVLAVTAVGAWQLTPDKPQPAKMPRVQLSADGKGFVLVPGGQPFRPWGNNYGNEGRLMEDFWEKEWQTLADDFKEMKDLGTNVVRVHLQFGKFMENADKPNKAALDLLGKLLDLAEKTGLYLDITGLGSYRKADIPAWYDVMNEADRWAAQGRFWEAVAGKCASHPAVFCYCLMNEPVVPSGKRKPGEWLSGKPLGGYDFVQYIALEQGDRPRPDIAVAWIKSLTAAIRKQDKQTLITVGLLPSMPKWGHYSGFVPEKVAPELDFVSMHIYPKTGETAEAVKTLKGFAVGKPLVIEEVFPLSCPASELKDFLRESKSIATGWVGHYDGITAAQYEEKKQAGKLTVAESFWLDWLNLFREMKPEMVGK